MNESILSSHTNRRVSFYLGKVLWSEVIKQKFGRFLYTYVLLSPHEWLKMFRNNSGIFWKRVDCTDYLQSKKRSHFTCNFYVPVRPKCTYAEKIMLSKHHARFGEYCDWFIIPEMDGRFDDLSCTIQAVFRRILKNVNHHESIRAHSFFVFLIESKGQTKKRWITHDILIYYSLFCEYFRSINKELGEDKQTWDDIGLCRNNHEVMYVSFVELFFFVAVVA